MRRAWVRSMLALLVVLASAMTWQDPDPRLTARLSGATRAAVIAIVDSAEREGLKAEPLIQLALEGESKGAPGERIVAAVTGHANYMRRAKEALGPESTPDEVAAGALALKNGIDVRQLERFRQERSGRRYAAALNSLTYIVGKGVPADTAAKVLVRLALMSATDAQIAAFQADVDSDISRGISAVAAATARAYGLERAIQEARERGGDGPGSTLPSARGTTRAADPSARGPVAGDAAGSAAPGQPPAGPRGKNPKRP